MCAILGLELEFETFHYLLTQQKCPLSFMDKTLFQSTTIQGLQKVYNNGKVLVSCKRNHHILSSVLGLAVTFILFLRHLAI
jgi:hypothetical protein